ncbi:MAG: hypothetical protein EA425_15910 [Puniceicoccaceae bacterium]|nr:MAG: hypothetical protein EA425_15910 [Puniceicoccaceae bacterium]
MKTQVGWLLVVSLLANGVLGYLLVVRSGPERRAGAGEAPTPVAADERRAAERATASGGVRELAEEAGAAVAVPLHYDAGDDEIREAIRRMRADGVPNDVIRAMVQTVVQKRFETLRANLLYPQDVPFWLQHRREGRQDRQMDVMALMDRQREVTEALLADVPEEPSEEARRRNLAHYGTVDPAKVRALQQLQRDHMAFVTGLHEEDMDQGERMRLMAAYAEEMEVQRAEILSPDEYREYQLRQSQASRQLMMHLDEATTREEFEALVDLEAVRHPPGGMRITQGAEAHRKLQLQNLEVWRGQREVLGDERFLGFITSQRGGMVRGLDQSHRGIALDSTAMVDAWEATEFGRTDYARAVSREGISTEERRAELGEVRERTLAELESVAGRAWLDAYLESSEGTWLREMVDMGVARSRPAFRIDGR